MKKLSRYLLLFFLTIAATSVWAGQCGLASSSCINSGCRSETAGGGQTVMVCTQGTANPPAGALIDTSTSCWDRHEDYACPHALTDCVVDPSCTKTSETCDATGAGGICTSYTQTYTCTKIVKVCTETKDLNSCVNVNTAGLQNQPVQANTNGFGKAMQAMALLNAIQKNISGTLPPTIFSGAETHCGDQAYCGGVNFQACCCDTSLKKSGGFLGCSTDEVKLAGARRQSLAHHLETCCSASVPLLGCVAHEQSYCVFDSVLGRIVQEQGREQLAALAAGGTGTTTQTPLSFSRFGGGGWLGPYSANGNDVWVWQWPSSCIAVPASGSTTAPAAPSSAAEYAATEQAISCPQSGVTTWWAACDGTGCTAPTQAPPNAPADNSLYVISTSGYSDGNTLGSTALSKYVVTTGACGGADAAGNQTCAYTLSGLTAGSAEVQTDLSWSLYGQAGWNPPATLGTNYQISGYSLDVNTSPTLGGTAPSTVSIEYASADSTGTTGSYTSATLPIAVPATSPVTLSGTNISLWGACTSPYYQCEYHLSEPATAIPKPWDGGCSSGGDPVNPDCTGFTLTQFMLLDISRMNLGEWLSTLNASVPDQASLQASADSSGVAAAASVAANPPAAPIGAQYDTSGEGETVLKLSASSCQVGTDCTITAWATSNWPTTRSDPRQNTAPVASVNLDWGDGTKQQTLTTTRMVHGRPLFSATHTYTAGGNDTVTAQFNMPPSATAAVHSGQAAVQAWIDDPPKDKTHQDSNGGAELIPQ